MFGEHEGWKGKRNRPQTGGQLWGEGQESTREATVFTAAPLGPSSSACVSGDATRKPQWNHVLALNHSSAAVVWFSYL